MSTTAPSRILLARWLVHHTRRLVPILGISVVARVAGQLAGVALFVLAADAIEHVGTGRNVSVASLIGVLVGISLLKALLRYLEHYAGHWVAFTALQRLRELFFSSLIPQAPATTTGRAGAELTDRGARDIDRIEVFFAHTFPPAVAAVLVPALVLTWLASVSGPEALTLAGFTLAVILLPLLASTAGWAGARSVAGRRGEVATRLGDDLQGVREILAFDAAATRLAQLDGADRALAGARSRSGAIQGARTGAIVALQAGSLLAVLVVGSSSGSSLHAVIVALAVGIGLWAPARGIDDFVAGLDAAFASAARVHDVVQAPPLVTEPVAPVAPGPDASVRLEHVTFSYPSVARAALADVTLEIETGRWTYVVGVSGSGKSSLARLLLRGWDPQAGSVLFAGADVSRVALDQLRGRIALVPQHPVLLRGGLAENLRLARPDADETELRDALYATDLDAWAAGLPDGLDTPVSGRGAGVSGGQLQRIALARALVAAPRLLILDEALSQLDANTAARVRERLAALDSGLTILEITHRADLVPDAAPVAVLDAGRLLECGTAAELRSAGGAFTRLEARN